MMLHLGFELVSHQLDCITNDSWLRCHVLFKVSYNTFLGNIVLSFSRIQLIFPSFAFASVASSPILFSVPFAAKKALQFSHWPCVRGSQDVWDDDGWDFLKAKHLHPKYPAGNEAIRGNRGFHRDLSDAGRLTFTPPQTKGVLGLGCPKMPLPKKTCF